MDHLGTSSVIVEGAYILARRERDLTWVILGREDLRALVGLSGSAEDVD